MTYKTSYKITRDQWSPTIPILIVEFGEPAQNNRIVQDASCVLKELDLKGGPLILVNGPASLPVAMVIAHHIAHLYEAVGVYDPKLGKYVVSISHSPGYQVGDLI